jgi:hypothetical protein
MEKVTYKRLAAGYLDTGATVSGVDRIRL